MKRKFLLSTISLTFIGLSVFASQSLTNYPTLLKNINLQLETSKQNNPIIPIDMQTDTGLYSSYVHMNFVGGPIRDEIRKNLWILDNNFFVTAWVMDALISDAENDDIITNELTSFNKSLDSLATYHDQNRPETDIISFWPQSFTGKQENWNYSASPKNLDTVMSDIKKLLGGAIVMLNNSILPANIKTELVSKLQSVDYLLNIFGDAFRIPADLDDTSLNFALGANLKELSDKNMVFSPLYQKWAETNTIAQIANSLVEAEKYAYSPSTQSSSMSNLIDPRSYYVLENFVTSMSNEDLQNLRLPTTWLMDMQDEAEQYSAGQDFINVSMPL